MPHLSLHHVNLRELTLLCLSALSGSVEHKTNWNRVHVFSLQLEYYLQLSAVTFTRESYIWGEPPVLLIPLSKVAFRELPNCCAEVCFQLSKQYVLNPAASLEGLQHRTTCKCGMMPSS